jgi:hypothetical protein
MTSPQVLYLRAIYFGQNARSHLAKWSIANCCLKWGIQFSNAGKAGRNLAVDYQQREPGLLILRFALCALRFAFTI